MYFILGPLVLIAGFYYFCRAFCESRRIGTDAAFLYLLLGIGGIWAGLFACGLAAIGL